MLATCGAFDQLAVGGLARKDAGREATVRTHAAGDPSHLDDSSNGQGLPAAHSCQCGPSRDVSAPAGQIANGGRNPAKCGG